MVKRFKVRGFYISFNGYLFGGFIRFTFLYY